MLLQTSQILADGGQPAFTHFLAYLASGDNKSVYTDLGSPAGRVRALVTVHAGVVIGSSSTATPAIQTGASFAAGSSWTLRLVGSALVVGKGGAGAVASTHFAGKAFSGQPGGGGGGAGHTSTAGGANGGGTSTDTAGGAAGAAIGVAGMDLGDGSAGQPGGPAVSTHLPLSVDARGTTNGGGGGGGGGAGGVSGGVLQSGQAGGALGTAGANGVGTGAFNGGAAGKAVELNGQAPSVYRKLGAGSFAGPVS
jgi:hypothetical protein